MDVISLSVQPQTPMHEDRCQPNHPNYWQHLTYTYLKDHFPAANLASPWLMAREGMYKDGHDFAGKQHPAFIKDTHTRAHQMQLIRKELMDTVSRLCRASSPWLAPDHNVSRSPTTNAIMM